MAWLFGSGKRAPSGQPDSRVARERQISNLIERVPSLQLKSTDSSLYEVQIHAPPDGALVMLRVFLPTKFPSERPVLQLLSPVSHPWVNQYMQVVGHPDLSGWDAVAPAMIGDIVSAVITEFSRGISGESSSGRSENLSPWGGQTAQRAGFPSVQIVGQSPHGQYPRGDISSVTGAKPIGEATINNQGRVANENAIDAPNPVHMRGRESRSNEPRRKAKDHTPIPVIPAKFDELQGMTTAQLSRLLDDDIARGAHLQGMPSVVGMKELRTEVRKGNVATAQSTLSNQDKARALRGEAERLRLMLKELQTSYEGKAQGRNKNLGGTADQVILKQVKHASKLADSSSERVANDFLEKKLPLPDFLDEFMKERQRYHMLAAKIECMKRDIRF